MVKMEDVRANYRDTVEESTEPSLSAAAVPPEPPSTAAGNSGGAVTPPPPVSENSDSVSDRRSEGVDEDDEEPQRKKHKLSDSIVGEIAAEIVEIPSETAEIPLEIAEIPSEIAEEPQKKKHKPLDSIEAEISAEIAEIPLETAEIPSEIAEIPLPPGVFENVDSVTDRRSPPVTKASERVDEDEEEPQMKKYKQLDSIEAEIAEIPAETAEIPPETPVAMETQTTDPMEQALKSVNRKAKSKKKSNNVWVKPKPKSKKKKGKSNVGQNGNNNRRNPNEQEESEDRVLITPVPKFPDKNDDSLEMKICLSKFYKAEKVELSEDRMSAGSTKGYRMVRATRGVEEGVWYFEIKVMSLGETGHTRLGWSTEKGDLQVPVGYDSNSYGYRDVDGSKIHKALREKYGEEGYGEGDVLGFYISLPEGRMYAPNPPQLVWYKGQRYMCSADPNDPPKTVPGSEISFFKNGVCQGVAFKDLFGGRYYPAASMYTLPNQPNCVVKFNFGPDFECFPEDFGERPLPKPMIEVPYHGYDGRAENGNQWHSVRMCTKLEVVNGQDYNDM